MTGLDRDDKFRVLALVPPLAVRLYVDSSETAVQRLPAPSIVRMKLFTLDLRFIIA